MPRLECSINYGTLLNGRAFKIVHNSCTTIPVGAWCVSVCADVCSFRPPRGSEAPPGRSMQILLPFKCLPSVPFLLEGCEFGAKFSPEFLQKKKRGTLMFWVSPPTLFLKKNNFNVPPVVPLKFRGLSLNFDHTGKFALPPNELKCSW